MPGVTLWRAQPQSVRKETFKTGAGGTEVVRLDYTGSSGHPPPPGGEGSAARRVAA